MGMVKEVNNRVAWIDDAKALAILLVVMGHSFSLVKGDFRGYDEINLFIVAFNMPLFALLSGITSFRSLSKISSFSDLMTYVERVSWRIGIPTVVYTLIAMTISYGMQVRWDRCVISLLLLITVCGSVFLIRYSTYSKVLVKVQKFFPFLVLPICFINQSVWYLVYVLMSLYAASISMFVSKKISKSSWGFYLSFIVFSIFISPFSPFYSTCEFLLPFIIGHQYAAINKDRSSYKDDRNGVGIILALSVIGIICFLYYYSIPNQFYYLNMFRAVKERTFDVFLLRQISAVAISGAIVLSLQNITKTYDRFSAVGAMTLGIYTIHAEFIGIGKHFLSNKIGGGALMEMLFVLVVTAILTFSSIWVIQLIRKSNFCKCILLGE